MKDRPCPSPWLPSLLSDRKHRGREANCPMVRIALETDWGNNGRSGDAGSRDVRLRGLGWDSSRRMRRPGRGILRWVRRFASEMRSEEHTSELQSLLRISYA